MNSAAWFAPSRVLFTSQEIEDLNAFAESIELDFGQLDVCRDNRSGRIYVVDPNNTPFGPANGMSPWDKEAALRALATDFAEEYLGA